MSAQVKLVACAITAHKGWVMNFTPFPHGKRVAAKLSVVMKSKNLNKYSIDIQDIPCYNDFIRYIQWHNLAFTTTEDLRLPTMIIYYVSDRNVKVWDCWMGLAQHPSSFL